MKKDVIYIDVEDDVTAIIGKIKKAEEKVVALVPPKRAGALQSAVNLRLIDRMVKAEKKHLVLVTNNQALIGLAASSKIPVAKNLQTKPEVPEVPALIVDDGDDIIDGASIPVGEHAKTSKVVEKSTSPRSKAIESVDVSLDKNKDEEVLPAAAVATAVAAKPAKKKKVPDFDSFRKKLFLAIGGGVALIALLIWMFVFAPAATVIITASTSPSPVSASVRLGGTTPTNYEEGVVSSILREETKEATVEFEATGEKDVGQKATGSMTMTRTSISSNPISIPAGTRFVSGDIAFVSTEAATLEGTSVGPGGIVQDSVTVPVVAQSPGEDHNVSPRTYSASVGGFRSEGSQMTGGTTKMAKVVTAADIERARGVLIGESTDEYKEELISQFTNGEKVIDSSFVIERGKTTSKPAVDKEAPDGKAVLSMELKMSIHAVAKAELESFLKSYLESKMDDEQRQRIFDSGAEGATIGNFREEGDSQVATINATGRIGPHIDEEAVKEEVKGLIYGEVQSLLESRSGIKEADVQFSYFWVRTVPNNTDKITVEFKVEDE